MAMKKRWGLILLSVLFFLALAAVISFSQTLKYRSSSRLLIIQDSVNLDAYSISKSNQYLGSLLTEAAYSGSFFELLSTSGSQVDWNYFNGDYKEQIKKWKNTIAVQNIGDTGIIQIEIYHPDRDQARALSAAVNSLMIAKNGLYQNGGDNLKLKIIDQPTLSSWPVRPNLPLNLAAGLAVGLLLGLSYVYYFPVAVSTATTPKININVAVAPARQAPIQPVAPSVSYVPEQHREQNKSFSGNIKNIVG